MMYLIGPYGGYDNPAKSVAACENELSDILHVAQSSNQHTFISEVRRLHGWEELGLLDFVWERFRNPGEKVGPKPSLRKTGPPRRRQQASLTVGGYQLQCDVRVLEGLLPPLNTSASKGAPTKPEAVEEMDVGSPKPGSSSLPVRGEVPMLTDESSQDSQSTSTSQPSSRSSASRSGPSEEGGSLAEQPDAAGKFGPQLTASQKRQLKKKQKALQAGPAETSVKPRQMSEELSKFFKNFKKGLAHLDPMRQFLARYLDRLEFHQLPPCRLPVF